MSEENFCIHGKKDVYVNFINENKFLTFDSVNLEYYELNTVGAKILYCISKKLSLEKIVSYITDEYDIDSKECKEIIINFLENLPFQELIYTNLIDSDIYLFLDPYKNSNSVVLK